MANRIFLNTLAATFAVFSTTQAFAQTYPSKPVRVVVPLAPGGATDIQARLFSQKMSEEFGKPFLVENRPGAGESVALQALKSGGIDGTTILVSAPTFTITPAFSDKTTYDPVRDFAPISLVTRAPYLVVVPPTLAVKSMAELIAYARANPNVVNFGTGGVGSPLHLSGLWIGNATKTQIAIIHYKGTGQTLTDLVASQLHFTFGNPISTLPLVKSGKLRMLAVTSGTRAKSFPDLATIAETVIPGFDVTTWHGWIAAKGTPADIVNRISTTLSKVVNAPDMSAKLIAEGGEPVGSTPEQFTQLLASETLRWSKLVKETGAKIE